MKWLTKAWPTLRDIVITGTGLGIIWVEFLLWVLLGRTPSETFLEFGAGLLLPAAGAHIRVVLKGTPAAGSSSPSSPSASPPPSSPSREEDHGE